MIRHNYLKILETKSDGVQLTHITVILKAPTVEQRRQPYDILLFVHPIITILIYWTIFILSLGHNGTTAGICRFTTKIWRISRLILRCCNTVVGTNGRLATKNMSWLEIRTTPCYATTDSVTFTYVQHLHDIRTKNDLSCMPNKWKSRSLRERHTK